MQAEENTVPAPASAPAEQPSSTPAATCNTTGESTPNTIEKININIRPIFDENIPAENNWLFRTVNRLHRDTRPAVIKKDLLFKEGDELNNELLIESERRLRTRRYLNSASVSSNLECPQNPQVDVSVREVWTLLPQVSFSHAGGATNYSFGVNDSNFLGTGKGIYISRSSTELRDSNEIDYYDANTGIYDSVLKLQYGDNSDGTRKFASLVRPFVALSTEWASGFTFETFDEQDTLYNAGKEANRFGQYSNSYTMFYGKKLQLSSAQSIHRVLAGYTHARNDFVSVGTPPKQSVFVPENREADYPWLEYQHISDGFIEAYNIQQINRIEDINLGGEFRARLGYVSSPIAAYDNAYVLNTSFSKGFSLGQKQMLLSNFSANSFYGDDGKGNKHFYNGVLRADLTYHWQDFDRGQFFVRVLNARGYQLFQDLPFELGGDTGLRGYPIRYEAGDRLQLISVEQRFFGQREWFSLFHLGAAVFYDEGRVWGASAIPQSQQGRLRDVGIGLRFSGTRTGNLDEGSHNILHIDLASPLDGDDSINKLQWIIKIKKSF